MVTERDNLLELNDSQKRRKSSILTTFHLEVQEVNTEKREFDFATQRRRVACGGSHAAD